MRLVTSYQVRARPARRLKSRHDCGGRPAARPPPRFARTGRPPGRCASARHRSPTDSRPKSAPRVLSVIVVPHRPAVLTAKLLSTIASCQGTSYAGYRRRLVAGRNLRQLAQLRSMIASTSPMSGWTYAKNFGPPTCPNSPENMSNSYDVVFTPKPVQNRIPIWVGGESGPALRRTVNMRRFRVECLPGFDFDHPPGSWIAPTEHDLKRP